MCTAYFDSGMTICLGGSGYICFGLDGQLAFGKGVWFGAYFPTNNIAEMEMLLFFMRDFKAIGVHERADIVLVARGSYLVIDFSN